MTMITDTQTTQSITGNRWITLGLILALLSLRYLVTGLKMFIDSESWVFPVYEVGTYLLVAVLLIWEDHSLLDYHINALAIWIMILFKPIETIYLSILTRFDHKIIVPMAFPKFPSLIIWIIALGLLIRFRGRLFQKGAVRFGDRKWLLFGGLAGLSLVLVNSFPMSLQIVNANQDHRNYISSHLINGLVWIPYQIGYAAVNEEPVFRGFLWGFLRKSGWRDIWIWLFQAGLFVFAHLYYIDSAPISFWFIIPLYALVFGWLAWRSRSISTSIVAHGVSNGLGYALGYIIAVLRL